MDFDLAHSPQAHIGEAGIAATTHVVLPGGVRGPRGGKCVVLDFQDKLEAVKEWFSEDGNLREEGLENIRDLIARLAMLGIGREEIESKVGRLGIPLSDLEGVLIFSDSARIWPGRPVRPWKTRYFYSPYPDRGALSFISSIGMTFIGTDGGQLEDPIANFANANHLFVEADESAIEAVQSTRTMTRAAVDHWSRQRLSTYALEQGLALYENLNISAGTMGMRGVLEVRSIADGATLLPGRIVQVDAHLRTTNL